MKEPWVEQPLTEASFTQALILFLNELRVALTGAQLLVAFLLSVPFTEKFDRLNELDHHVYFVAFISALTAASLLIAPSVYHRMHLHRTIVDPAKTLATFTRLAVTGSAFLALAMTAASFLVTGLLYPRWAAMLVAAIAAAGFAWFWFGLPRLHHVLAKAEGRTNQGP